MNTRPYQITLDGITFEGELPFHVNENRPDLGPLTRGEDLAKFNRAVAGKVAAHGLIGPDTLRFCRKVAQLGVEEFASLVDHNRKAVQRWESGEHDVPRVIMVFAATIAQGPEHVVNMYDALQAFLEEHEVPSTIHVEAA